jgi:hypothetical protein
VYQTLRHKKTCRKFVILPRCPHDDRDAVVFNSDFQRLFGSQEISLLATGGTVHPLHRNFSDSAAKRG